MQIEARLERRRKRARVLALVALASLVLFLGLGHGLHAPMSDMDEGPATDVATICLVLFTVIVPLVAVGVLPSRLDPPRPVHAAVGPRTLPPALRPCCSRASPDWLQRFRN